MDSTLKIIVITLLGYIGAYLGAFFIQVIENVPNKEKVFKKVKCPSCQHTIGWSSVPLALIYSIRRGRCKHCGRPLPTKYLKLGLVTGLSFVILGLTTQISYILFLEIVTMSFLIPLGIIDYFTFTLPRKITNIMHIVGVINITLIYSATRDSEFLTEIVIIYFLTRLLLTLIAKVGYKRKGEITLGGGDIKLICSLALLVPHVLSKVIFCSCGLALIYIIVKRVKRVPLGTFLALGTYIVFILSNLLTN